MKKENRKIQYSAKKPDMYRADESSNVTKASSEQERLDYSERGQFIPFVDALKNLG